MTRRLTVLEDLQVASPCPVAWDGMTGGEQVRFCESCQSHVYNLSEMARDDAEQLVREAEGRLCVRFSHQADGTVLTRDRQTGLRWIGRRVVAALGKMATLLGFAMAAGGGGGCVQGEPRRLMGSLTWDADRKDSATSRPAATPDTTPRSIRVQAQ